MMLANRLAQISIVIALLVACDEPVLRGLSDGSVVVPDAPSAPGNPSSPKTYPRYLSWTNIDTDGDGVGEDYITSVKSQPCSDCYLYAATALVEARWQIDHKTAVSLDLSEQNVHNCMKIPCDGMGDLWWVLNYIRDYGIVLEENMPSSVWLPTCENCLGVAWSGLGPVPIRNVPFYRIKQYDTLDVPKEYDKRKDILVAALQEGPVGVGINAWLGYRNYNGTLYCNDPKPVGSGHVVLVVGYLESGTAFLVKNSHGEGKLITMVFAGGDKCGFASEMIKLPTDSVYVSWGGGEAYCYSDTDSDKDGIPDSHDNCPWDSNQNQDDVDKDGWGDACDRCPDTKDPVGYYCPR
jgi:hypothetical protein